MAPDLDLVSAEYKEQTLVRRDRSIALIKWANLWLAVSGLAFHGNSKVAKSCHGTGRNHSATATDTELGWSCLLSGMIFLAVFMLNPPVVVGSVTIVSTP
jgi:hypothetical protein